MNEDEISQLAKVGSVAIPNQLLKKTPTQVLKAQQTAGKIAGVAGGIASLAGQTMSMVNEAKNIQTAAPSAQVDAYGRPMYNLGNFSSTVSAIRPQGATGGELLNSAMQGAQAGAAFGPWGAAIGGAASLLTTAFAGKRRKTLQQRKKSLAEQSLASAQRMYNQGIDAYNSRESAQSLYQQQYANSDQRMNNVYQALS